jgi:hypothetical protein
MQLFRTIISISMFIVFLYGLVSPVAPEAQAATDSGPLRIQEISVNSGTLVGDECASVLEQHASCRIELTGSTSSPVLRVGTDRGTTTVTAATSTPSVVYIHNASGSGALLGTEYTDIIFGDQQPNQIWARGGDDIVFPGDGSNQLVGGAGNDTFIGYENNGTFIMGDGSGVDTIRGYLAGSDRIQVPPRVNGANAYYEGRALLRQTYNTVDGARVPLGEGNEVLLSDVRKRELRASDFFVGELPSPPEQRTENTSSDETSTSSGSGTVPPSPTIFFSLFPPDLERGQTGTLTWSATNADRCSASGAWSGSRELVGSTRVTPTTSATYRLTCRSAHAATSSAISLTFPGSDPAPGGTTEGSATRTPASESGAPRASTSTPTTQSTLQAGTPTSTAARYDVTGDGAVTNSDQDALISAWRTADVARGDLNGDGIVNAIDFSLMRLRL